MTRENHQFDLSGGALCLDFANTLGDRPHGDSEHLRCFQDLVAWARQAGVVDAGEADELAARAADEPRQAEAALAGAVVFRETLYRIFSALAKGGEGPDTDDLATLNSVLRDGLAHLEVSVTPDGFAWAWRTEGHAPERILWPVARSAAELLTSDAVPRLRECASETCGWLFVDRSPGRRRRWCDMATCGNRAKARRYYARRKAERAGSG